jgi:hypothetical protein
MLRLDIMIQCRGENYAKEDSIVIILLPYL